MSDSWVIRTKGLTKDYGTTRALDSVDFEIAAGATGLLGPNGSGKSTLIKCLLGLIEPSEGTGDVLGHDISTEGAAIRSRIGYMPEYDCLHGGLQAIHQVTYSGELLGMNPSVAQQRAHEVLEYVGLREQRYRAIETFSTGMKQSTKLACALIHDPDLIVCDEPTNGLDPQIREFMLNTMKQILSEGKRSLLMSSHLMDDVEEICDSILMIHKGKVIARGKIEDLKAIDREIEVHVWGGTEKLERALKRTGMLVRRSGRVLRIRRDDEDTMKIILGTAAAEEVQIRRMFDHEASLEDLFLAIMDRLGYGIGEMAPDSGSNGRVIT